MYAVDGVKLVLNPRCDRARRWVREWRRPANHLSFLSILPIFQLDDPSLWAGYPAPAEDERSAAGDHDVGKAEDGLRYQERNNPESRTFAAGLSTSCMRGVFGCQTKANTAV